MQATDAEASQPPPMVAVACVLLTGSCVRQTRFDDRKKDVQQPTGNIIKNNELPFETPVGLIAGDKEVILSLGSP